MSASKFVLRSLVLAAALLVRMRIVGKRLVGQVSAVDLVVASTVGTIAGAVSISDKVPLWVLALRVWGAFEWVRAAIAPRSSGFEALVSGRRTTLVEGGHLGALQSCCGCRRLGAPRR